MNLRSATAGDVAAVADLEEQLFGVDAWSAALLTAELTAADRIARVAEEDADRGGDLLGYAITFRSGDAVDLQRVGVRPTHRRRGVATALLEDVLDAGGAAGADRMLLEVSAANHGAIGFYRRHGFSEIARRRRYYRDGTDAIVMRRPVGPAPTERGGQGDCDG